MQHLRDNNGILEASSDGTTWEPVVLGEGGGGPLTNPFVLGDIQIREDTDHLEISSDAGATWDRVWDQSASMLSLDGKQFFPPLVESDAQPGTWSLSIGAIALWWEPTAQKLWLIYWRAQDEWYRIQLGPPETIADEVGLGEGGIVRISNTTDHFMISEDGGATFTRPAFPEDLEEITIPSTGFIDASGGEFYPPLIEADTEPAQDGLIVWHDTTVGNEKFYVVYRTNNTNHKIQLT